MYEGLVTNLFVVMDDGTIVTAPDEVVLNGVMRTTVLQVCREKGVKVVYRCPEMKESARFRAAFLTSVARILQPVHSFWWKGQQVAVQSGAQWEELVDTIREAVWWRTLSEATAFQVNACKENMHVVEDVLEEDVHLGQDVYPNKER